MTDAIGTLLGGGEHHALSCRHPSWPSIAIVRMTGNSLEMNRNRLNRSFHRVQKRLNGSGMTPLPSLSYREPRDQGLAELNMLDPVASMDDFKIKWHVTWEPSAHKLG
jgi:hypothetical protein